MTRRPTTGDLGWPAHAKSAVPWQQTFRGGTREDRMLREVVVSLPSMIANTTLTIDAQLATDLEAAAREISHLDATHGAHLEALGLLLLRTESVASSKIESIEASMDDYARALHGVKSNSSAVAMVSATAALEAMVGGVALRGRIAVGDFTSAHALLMRSEPLEGEYAGRLRDVQNWIGGSDHSPRSALFVPPPPATVTGYLDDLVAFANRDDLPALVQAAIAHAQFESIHPFTDGNGRIGRALINSILRLRGTTTRVVVPLASSLVAHRERYFGVLDTYRTGDVRPLIAAFAVGSRIAASEAMITAHRLREIPAEWQDMVGPVRRGSTVAALLTLLPSHPILSADDACRLVNGPRSSVFATIDRLHATGVLRPLTTRQRAQVWGASAILDELDDLGTRIANAST